jgi:hypothetical protein
MAELVEENFCCRERSETEKKTKKENKKKKRNAI